MIVICTKCQAKFRVPDEKVGPRGAKVRCSRCETVFVVQPQAASAPATPARGPELDLEPATGGRPARRAGLGPSPFARSTDVAPTWPPPTPPPPSAVALAPPFPASVGDHDPFAASVGDDDPFAAAAASSASAGQDPFAAASPAGAAEPSGGDDPFGAAAPAPRSTLPVTDLSDLLGAASATPPATPPPLPPLPPTVGALAPPAPAADPFAPAPLSVDDGGLALEDRLTPTPVRVKVAASADPLEIAPEHDAAFADPFGAAPGQPFDPGSFEYAADPGAGALALASEAPSFEDAPGAAAPAPAASLAPARAAPAAAAGAATSAAPARAVEPPLPAERIPGQRGSRIRAVLVNAVALAALLLVALAMLVAWRSEGSLDVASLRPRAVLRALRGDVATAGPFTAVDVRGGVYERARGAPLLFVSGRAVSRAAAPVAALADSVEVVRGPEVIARGEAIAGAVPTPEELHGAADARALAEVAARARARAPARVEPGDAVPFLAAIGDAPGDLDGASLRVAITPLP
jgi:predicted Zn finger-like uncharacterized protein